jgi:hypothetical protein
MHLTKAKERLISSILERIIQHCGAGRFHREQDQLTHCHWPAIRWASRVVKFKNNYLPGIRERVRWCHMLHAPSLLAEGGAALFKPGFALGEFPFSNSEHEKADAEAVQDWESEGGASTHLDEEAFAEAVTRLTSNRKSQ